MFGFELYSLSFIFAIFMLGGMVKGVLGFGLPLITMSLLPFIVPVHVAVVLSALVQPATNIGQLIQAGVTRESIKVTYPVLLTLAPGVAIGVWYLASVEEKSIILIIGVMVILYALYNLVGFSLNVPKDKIWPVGTGVGFVAGLVGALTSINGMFFIMYLVGLDQPREAFRSNIAICFIASSLLIGSGFWIGGFLNSNLLIISIMTLIPAFIGMGLGNWLGARVPNEVFRMLVLFALLIIGIVFLFRGLNA